MSNHIETQADNNTKWEKVCDCDELDFCSWYNIDESFKELYCCVCDKPLKRRKDLE